MTLLHCLCVFILLIVTFCNGNERVPAKKYDVIVVGMGAAGCAAASRLAREGKRVLGIEAQDYIGGRVHTVPFGSGIVEIGAEWIHGTEDSRVYDSGLENNVTMLPQDIEGLQVFRPDGTRASEEIAELLLKGMEFAEIETDKPEPLGELVIKKMMEYMREKTPNLLEDKDLIEQMLASLNLQVSSYEASNDWNDVNAHTGYDSLGGNQHMSWHRHGYKTFFEILLNKYNGGAGLPTLEIKLKNPVKTIEWAREGGATGALVTVADGTQYEAENVIVTVSLGVLKERHKTLFKPVLPQEKQDAIEKIAMGVIGKIIFSFPQPWWDGKNTIIVFLWRGEDVAKVPEKDRWITKIMGASIPMGSDNSITLWTNGDITRKVESLPEDEVKVKTLSLLRRFVNQTIPEPTGMLRTMWASNEFTRGSYTFDAMTADEQARVNLGAPLQGAGGTRLLFAGEATNIRHFGTVHGATETGLREAERLVQGKTR